MILYFYAKTPETPLVYQWYVNTMIRFIFFDLGNVLVKFSIARLLEQGAALTGCEIDTVRSGLFADGISARYECGDITEDEYCSHFVHTTGIDVDRERLENALCDIFTLNESIIPALEELRAREVPLGILSNTGPGHWRHCQREFPKIFESIPSNYILSYEVGTMKPDRKIYAAAMKTAAKVIPGIAPGEVMFFDDLAANVEAAREFGFAAVIYTDGLNIKRFF